MSECEGVGVTAPDRMEERGGGGDEQEEGRVTVGMMMTL